jgi:hypothetical protein
LAKYRGEVFAQFEAVALKRHRTDCVACNGEFFVNFPFDVKENYEHAFDIALHLSFLFQSP